MAEKRTKDQVDYGVGDVDGAHCGACVNFIEPIRCELVGGKIRSGGWCRLFERKGKAKAESEEKKDDSVSKGEDAA